MSLKFATSATSEMPSVPSGLPFFLPTSSGQRFCIYHAPPNPAGACAAVLYVHPFGEEMNRSRRVAALQARAFAAAGVAVLQIDLLGCGDSSGDFVDARWQTWKDDLAMAHGWLADKVQLPVTFWGLRLGALLMLDYARQASYPIDRFILWQPVVSGHTWLTQWLRLHMAGNIVNGDGTDSKPAGSLQALRTSLIQGQPLEIAGYELAPELAAAIDTIDAGVLAPGGYKVDWFDIAPNAGKPLAPASASVIARWQSEGVLLEHHPVPGQAFWSVPEVTSCPALLSATLDTLRPQ